MRVLIGPALPSETDRIEFFFPLSYAPQILPFGGIDASVQSERRIGIRRGRFLALRFGSGTVPSRLGSYLVKNMLGVDPAGSELRSISGQHVQEPLTVLVDERDFVEVHDARASCIAAVVFLPTGPKLMHPGHGEAPIQNPSLFCRRFAETDLQNAVSLRACPGKDFLQDWPASGDFRQRFVGDVTEDNTERDRKYNRLDIHFISSWAPRR